MSHDATVLTDVQKQKQSNDVVNLLKEIMDQDVTEINSDCGHEHKE